MAKDMAHLKLVAAIVSVMVLLGACDKALDPAAHTGGNASVDDGAVDPTAAAEAEANKAMTLTGTPGHDRLVGKGGADHLTGGPGADVLDGASGFDYARYDSATEGVVARLSDSAGNIGDAAGDVYISIEGMAGSPFDDTVQGDDGVNDMHGLAGNDIVYGLGGDDSVVGEEGDDLIDGGPGKDNYVGGPGSDTFIFHAGEASGDSIEDFEGAGVSGGDTIQLIGYGAGATFTKTDPDTWVVTSADGKISDTITIKGGDAIAAGDYNFK
jgi:serralysin